MAREHVVCLKRDGGCGKRFYREVGSSQELCTGCAPPPEAVGAVLRPQNWASLPETPGDGVEGPQDGTQRFLGSIESATLETLTKRKRLATPEGAIAMHIAHLLDNRVNSGAEVAAMSKALREALREAMAGAPAESDGVDDLARRRATRSGRGA